ncbi:MAG: tetratricopeptide repeat protein [Bacteroidota bacterium]
MKKAIIFLVVITTFTFAYADNAEIDSLRVEISKAETDTVKASLYIDLGILYMDVIPDSAIFFYNQAKNVLESNDDERSKVLYSRANVRTAYSETTHRSNPTKALQILDSALVVLNELENTNDDNILRLVLAEKTHAYNNYGSTYRLLGDYKEALNYYEKALDNAKKVGDDDLLLGICYLHLGNIYRYLGELDKAMENNLMAADAYERIGEEDRIAAVYNNIGNVFHVQGNYSQALNYYQDALRLFEKLNDKIRAGSAHYNIGVVHFQSENYDNAMTYFEKALAIREEIDDKKGMINSLMVMGMIGEHQKDTDVAILNYERALNLAHEIEDMSGIAHGYTGLAGVYKDLKDYVKAVDYNNRALEIFERTGNASGILGVKNSLAACYLLMDDNYKAIEYAKQAYDLAKEIGSLSSELESSNILSNAYENLDQYKNAFRYSRISYELSDSIFTVEKAKAISETEAKFQTERKQLEIDNLLKEQALKELEIANQKEEVTRQKQLNTSLLIGIVLVAGFSFLLLREYRAKKKANKLLSEQNADINQKNEEIKAQRDELGSQRDYVIKQKDMIEASHRRITDSINYAQLIQSALLPSSEVLDEILPEHLVFYKPRDIVSGDFYWVKQIKHYTVVIAADCTGHGVPGAFMSMLGIAFLNEISRKEDVNTAADILNLLRQEIKSALYQKHHDDKANDGMDMGVLFIDKNNMEAHYAGAKNSLFVLRSNKHKEEVESVGKIILTENNDNLLVEVKGDSQSVSLTPSETEFTNQKLKLFSDDILYLFSDGYIDQISGMTNRRFNTTRFKDLLFNIYKEPLSKQHSLLEKTYNEWRGDNEQIDDIIIVGIKL